MSNFMQDRTERDFSAVGGPGSLSERFSTGRPMEDMGLSNDEERLPPQQQPFFTVVEISDSGAGFANEWRPTMPMPEYIGNTSMLLTYLYGEERHHKVTMPIKACGVDPIVFQNVEILDTGDDQQSRLFMIPVEGSEQGPVYELIKVDGELYLSCMSECLDSAYLNSIIAEATSAVKACGHYTFQMVGFKKLALEEGEQEGRLLNTLRLNTYEMSVLIAYMQQFDGIQVNFMTVGEHQVIDFKIV